MYQLGVTIHFRGAPKQRSPMRTWLEELEKTEDSISYQETAINRTELLYVQFVVVVT